MKHFLKFGSSVDSPSKLFFINKENETLGFIVYFEPWKEYVAEFYDKTFMSVDCLGQIQKKLKELNKR